ncbi:hypothetical protein QP786_08580, partial [Gleimia europaea]|nr:hypothetical protein [Gleimia europaea]
LLSSGYPLEASLPLLVNTYNIVYDLRETVRQSVMCVNRFSNIERFWQIVGTVCKNVYDFNVGFSS